MLTRVVNLRAEKNTHYIGRTKDSLHFGNPFAMANSNIASVQVNGRYEAIKAFYDWLKGDAHQNVEPVRRAWVLDNIVTLRGKTLGCFCKPKCCHGDVLRVFLDELKIEDVLADAKPAEPKKSVKASDRPGDHDSNQMALL